MLMKLLNDLLNKKNLNEEELTEVKKVLVKALKDIHYAQIHLSVKNLDKVVELLNELF